MISSKQELIQAMTEAFVMEKGTNEFYMQAASKARDDAAKKVFRDLAGWEHDHMLYIQFLYQSFVDDREGMTFGDFKAKVKPETVEGGIPMPELEEKFEKYEFIDDMGALILALEIEGRAFNLYRKLSDEATNPSVKTFMKEMMNWELKHIDYLKGLRLTLAETS